MRAMVTMAVVAAMAASAAPARAARLAPRGAAMVAMTVRAVGALRGQPVVLLEDAARHVQLPIWIGEAEANAIDLRLHGAKAPRPLTVDLLDRALAALGARVERVEVIDLRDDVFIGRLTIRDAAGVTHPIDARPSDAIALALGAGLPVFVAPHVVEKAALSVTAP